MVSVLHFHSPSAKNYVKLRMNVQHTDFPCPFITLLKFSDANVFPTRYLKEAQLCLLQQQ